MISRLSGNLTQGMQSVPARTGQPDRTRAGFEAAMTAEARLDAIRAELAEMRDLMRLLEQDVARLESSLQTLRMSLKSAGETQRAQIAGAMDSLRRRLDEAKGLLSEAEERGRALDSILEMLTARAEDPVRRQLEWQRETWLEDALDARAYARFREYLQA
jgi:septal ring factor EnvC (AmiA/AmiB activator)